MNNNNIGTSQFLVYAAIIIIMIRILQNPRASKCKVVACKFVRAALRGRAADQSSDICHAHVMSLTFCARRAILWSCDYHMYNCTSTRYVHTRCTVQVGCFATEA